MSNQLDGVLGGRNNNLGRKLQREYGLCTLVICTDAENIERIRYILQAYENGTRLEYAERTNNDWQQVNHVPMDFASLRYRVAQSI
jgi:hypothetical protein